MKTLRFIYNSVARLLNFKNEKHVCQKKTNKCTQKF